MSAVHARCVYVTLAALIWQLNRQVASRSYNFALEWTNCISPWTHSIDYCPVSLALFLSTPPWRSFMLRLSHLFHEFRTAATNPRHFIKKSFPQQNNKKKFNVRCTRRQGETQSERNTQQTMNQTNQPTAMHYTMDASLSLFLSCAVVPSPSRTAVGIWCWCCC